MKWDVVDQMGWDGVGDGDECRGYFIRCFFWVGVGLGLGWVLNGFV